MIGLLLIYFIGREFYRLAREYEKHKWGFAILGIASYYAGTFIGGIIIALFSHIVLLYPFEDMSDWLIGLIAVPFGLLACTGTFKFLKSRWKKHLPSTEATTLDGDLVHKNPE